jgi:hypothetical protein
MWSHYAEHHTGICLEFRSTSSTLFFGRAQKVHYKTDHPELNYFRSSREEWVNAIMLTKAKFWEYEEEWRIIEHAEGPGTYRFPHELLTGIVLGCRMADDKKQKIIQWLRKRASQPRLYQAKVRDKEYGLDIVELRE